MPPQSGLIFSFLPECSNLFRSPLLLCLTCFSRLILWSRRFQILLQGALKFPVTVTEVRGTGVWRAIDLTLDYNQRSSTFCPVYVLCFCLTLCLKKGFGGYNKFAKAVVLTVFRIKSDHFKLQIPLFLVPAFPLMFSTTSPLHEPFASVKMICSISSDISWIATLQNLYVEVLTSNIPKSALIWK